MEVARATRTRLNSWLKPEQMLAWLREDADPLVLSGEWFGLTGATVLASEPVRVADPWRDDPFALLTDVPTFDGGDAAIGGGWAGWLGYGLGARIEALPPGPPPQLARPPFWLGFYDHLLLHDGSGWWFESLPTPGRADLLGARLELWRERLTQPPPAPKGGGGPPAAATWPPPAPLGSGARALPTPFRLRDGGGAAHLAAVAEAKQRIAAGELFQANLCLRLEADFDGDGLALAAAALPAARPRFGAFVGGTLSLSPERFLRRAGRQVSSEPIKGTAVRSGDPAAAADEQAALAGSAKDAAEHVMIVDLMRNDLGRVCRYGSVHAEPARIEPYAGVWHLVSTVSGELRPEVDDGALLAATFPPGSVTGAPKVQALKVIAELESSRREAYTGAVGMVSPLAGLDLNVAIRTFELGEGRIWIGVGGGIVSGSDPEAELREALTKAAGPIAALGAELELPQPRPAVAAPRPAAELALRHGTRPDASQGVFETILARGGRATWLAAHLRRLAGSLESLYGVTLSPEQLEALAAEVGDVSAASGPRARVRVLAEPDGTLTVTGTPEPVTPASAAPLRLEPFVLPGGLGAHKWRDRRLLEALSAAAAPGSVPLLIEHDGTVLEAAHANVWIAAGDELLTPPADGRVLPGVTRAALLAATPGAREQPLKLEQLRSAETIFLSSAISGRRAARL